MSAPNRLDMFLGGLRRESLARTGMVPGEPGALLDGMILGDRSRASPALTSAMSVTGLTHLTAVSAKIN